MLRFQAYISYVSEERKGIVSRGLGRRKGEWARAAAASVRGNTSVQRDIYDMISKTYGPLGGHHDFPTASSVPHDNDLIDLIDLDDVDDPDSVVMGKTTVHGRKMTATASDGERESKEAMLRKMVKTLAHRGNYGEVSGKVMEILTSRGVRVVTDRKVVEKILSGKQIQWHGRHPEGAEGTGWYSRRIGGAWKYKRIVGNPNP